MKKKVKVRIAKEDEQLSEIERDITEAGAPILTDNLMKEKLGNMKEIVINPGVVEQLKKMGIPLDEFIADFKRKAGLE